MHYTCSIYRQYLEPKQWNSERSNIIRLDHLVYILCTSYYAVLIYLAIPCIKLQLRLSQFWRHHKGSPRWFLSTIEAIHQLLVEYTDINGSENASLENYDNLLFFFRFMYEKIHILYEHDELKAYRRPVNI